MPKMYAGRSLVLYALRFNRRMHPDEEFDPMDVDGESVLSLFSGFVEALGSSLFQVGSTAKFVTLGDAVNKENSVLLSYDSGRAGENGRVVDIGDGSTRFEFGGDSATMVNGRALLRVPDNRSYALMCVEHVAGGAGDTTVIEYFKSYLLAAKPDVVVKRKAVLEKKGVDAIASVDNVEVIRYLSPSDIADPLSREGDRVTIKLSHRRNHPFSIDLFNRLRRNRDAVKGLFGVQLKDAALDDPSVRVFTTIKTADGRTRRFEVSDSFEQPLREVLNDDGQPPLDDSTFINRCVERCEYAESIMG